MYSDRRRYGNEPKHTQKDVLRLQLAAQLASHCQGRIAPVSGPQASRSRTTRDAPGTRYILVVDDEPSVIELVSVAMEEKKCRIVGAASVAEARSILQSRSDIAMVITDLKMPVEDGFAMLEFLRSNLRFQHIPAIVFTSCADYRYVKQAIDMGAKAYLAKPFTSEQLVERVTGVLESNCMSIVLVTDDDACRAVLGRALSLAGYSVVSATSGEQTLELIKAHRANLIVSEFVLPDMTGLDMLEKSTEVCSGIPFIFIGDPLLRVDAEVVRAAGGHGLIQRPFVNIEILNLIKSVEMKTRTSYSPPAE